MAKKAKKTNKAKKIVKTKKKARAKKVSAKKEKAAPKERPPTLFEVVIRKKVFGEAPQEYHFVLEDGRKLKNIYELLHELEKMTDSSFRKHVNEFKNDFSNWLKDVFDMPDAAEEIRFIEDRLEAQRRLMRKIIDEVKAAAQH